MTLLSEDFTSRGPWFFFFFFFMAKVRQTSKIVEIVDKTL